MNSFCNRTIDKRNNLSDDIVNSSTVHSLRQCMTDIFVIRNSIILEIFSNY